LGWDSLTVELVFTQQLSIDRPICARPQQQTCWPPLLLLIDGTDRRTLNRFMTLAAYCVDGGVRLASVDWRCQEMLGHCVTAVLFL